MLTYPSLKGKKIFVTGASGFLGRHLLPALLSQGASITCLIRSKQAALSLPAQVAPVEGDCGDAEAVKAAVKDQDIVIHLAGFLFGNDWRDYIKANSLYARNLAHACAAEPGLERVVYISSLAAAGPAGRLPGKNEAESPAPVSAYGWSKLIAEEILGRALGEKLVILRPPIIYGSGDKGLLPLFKSCRYGLGLSPGWRRFPVSIIHADDVVQAILKSLGPQANGVYHLSDGHAYDMDQICQAMGKAQNRAKVRMLHPPLKFMGLTAALSGAAYNIWSGICGLTGMNQPRPPAWNKDKYLEAIQEGWLADNSRAVKELDFKPALGLEAGMNEAVAGYRKEGWL